MLDTLISSKTRLKLLFKFFLNSNTRGYLRGLESEFGESSNAIRLELNRLEHAGMLSSELQGNKKFFRANVTHPLYAAIQNILHKHIGLDRIIENVVERLGKVEKVYLAGKFARGLDSQIIDLILIGDIDKEYLVQLIEKVEKLINRKVRYLIFTEVEFDEATFKSFEQEPILLWVKE
jgi:DNA-binding transcriptional ArsR family regulator